MPITPRPTRVDEAIRAGWVKWGHSPSDLVREHTHAGDLMAKGTCRQAAPRPALFRALGAAEPPEKIEIDGRPYRRVEIFKHDSWAATALYIGSGPRMICKFNRVAPVGWLSLRWLGRWLAEREAATLQDLADVDLIPALGGTVTAEGQPQPHAVARLFIPGHPLAANERVGRRFFMDLAATLRRMHAAGIAYVDLHKRENIIVGPGGRPYLIDFQVCYRRPRGRWAHLPLWDWLLDQLVAGDKYHLAKHAWRQGGPAPGSTAAEVAALRPGWLKLHRLIAEPLREARRRLLVLLGIRTGSGRAHTETAPEDAVRREMTRRAA